ncbi:protein transport protein Sec24-like At4g32640 [Tripterygium wilfordii]|uniref:protein transport protein Sec24-like At4g32640 n=1 Tax=Tripterygium wilfordii TaxID=458696 RepID=UPI0018F7F22B|nr:protein transport protein Sec24-like At4g32640 [Tripterygium wilfordii]
MAAPVPPGAPRPGYNQQRPPPNYNPNLQSNPTSLADNMQNLNLNRPASMPGSGPRLPPFAQAAPFGQSAPSPGFPAASPPFSRPGPPPAALSRPAAPPSGFPPSTFPPNVAQARPRGPPVSQPQPPPFASRPPPGSLPSTMGGPVVPPAGAPSNFPYSGIPSGGIGATSQPPGARPSPFPSALPLSAAPVMPSSSTLGGPVSNGTPLFASGPLTTAPGYPPASSSPQPPMGPPPTISSARAPPQAPSMHSFMGSPTVGAPPGASMQMPSPFLATSQGVPPSMGSPYGPQSWPMQPQQVGAPPPIPGSVQQRRMFGMHPTLPHQSTTISPATGQTGAPVAGPSRIDPHQIPRPIPSATAVVHETRVGNQANPPPPATSYYIVRDTGNCSPRHMRSTISQIPCTVDLLSTSGMQLALLVQPLALPHPSEEPIQVVDFGESGPIRCSRCKGYINPFMKFIDQGRKFICNLCGFADETPRDYHCNLGPDGRRRDAEERPELCSGTVEFVATKEYMVRDPMPAVYFFLIDVSMNAIQTGATAAACSAINQVISDLPDGPRTLVGIATFDSTIHFYNLKRSLQQPLMLIVPDVNDVYTPLQTDIVVQLSECRQHLELLLESIPTMFENKKTAESAFGAAIKAAFLAIKSTGGKLLVFQSVLPSVGIGSLSSRDAEGRTNISAGDKEAHKLLQPADKTLKTMAVEFAEYQVCVDLFITTQSYVDIASISVIPRTTGGQVYYYHPFSALSDPSKLYNDLRWNVTRPQAFEAVMRVRCSQGIQVQEYSGNFCRRIPTDIDLPGIDCDKTIMVTLKHDDKLQDGSECAFQCALLYTTVYGQRRIRVINLSLPCTSMLSNLFRSADLDTQFACFLKQAAHEIPSSPLSVVKEQVTNHCINILPSYRKFCATVSSSGQLILPEALKLLPLYTLALIKGTGLRTDGKIDERSFWINYVSFLSTPLAIPLVYPRMVAIHDLNSQDDDKSLIPPAIPLSSEHVSDEGIYLLENGDDGLIYIGNSVHSDILTQLFGFSSIDEIPTQFVLQQYDNPLSKKLNDVVNEIRRQRCSYLRLKLCKKGDPSGMLFLSYLVEDKNSSLPSYVEFLVHIHRQIQLKMS